MNEQYTKEAGRYLALGEQGYSVLVPWATSSPSIMRDPATLIALKCPLVLVSWMASTLYLKRYLRKRGKLTWMT